MSDSVDARIEVTQGDITQLEVDAIVNAANKQLAGGGGVDGAIHRAAGPELKDACRKIGGCAPGQAVVTPGFKLPAKHIVHTVGPVWSGGTAGEDETLAQAYRSSLKRAAEHDARTVAFPAISTGAYGFPLERATQIAVDTVRSVLGEMEQPEKVIFCCFDAETKGAYAQALERN
ncbi:O-acetyl-ADP-ribose deacetylase [Rhodovibrio salinarum]|uniref:O-acetyl-ADP-ribose deacetylase n=1 Tax=Rhodovibrio salinarum TaxID=1087 RepID=A0A934UZM9_9PROT|nr:O-acetyl-ADP-ribose deacetylase [Rhodovibrio salinarum]MBK1696913.1 O-acetyl-ADP-ribose deacetylase [Rhodovibrio salinarum]